MGGAAATQETPARRLRSLVFAGDDSPESRVARRAAADLALRSGAAVHVVTSFIGGLPWAFIDENSPCDPWFVATELLRTEGEAMRAAGVMLAGCHIGVGSLSEAVIKVAAATDADLIVLGCGLAADVARFVARSPSAAVAAGQTSMLAVPSHLHAWPPDQLIVGCDRSQDESGAVDVATAIAHLYPDTSIQLLKVRPCSNAFLAAARAAESRAAVVVCMHASMVGALVDYARPEVELATAGASESR